MGPIATAAASRYRTRHQAPTGTAALPPNNLLWRDPKVPLLRSDASVQLELIEPAHTGPQIPEGLPNRERLQRERIERTIQETLAHLRPQVHRAVREIEMQLPAAADKPGDTRAVDSALALLETHLREFADASLACNSWSQLGDEQ